MSAGSKIVPVRIPDDLLVAMLTDIASPSAWKRTGVPSVSQWIRDAIEQRLAHRVRARRRRGPNDKLIASLREVVVAREGE